MASKPKWLVEALKGKGQREYYGRKHNPYVLQLWRYIRAPFTDDETAWCAGFVGGMFEKVGIKSTRSARARSYMNWGVKLSRPRVGCVVVFWRGNKNGPFGHVGFVVGITKKGDLLVLGGNQGDMVSIKPFDTARVLSYRWPAGHPIPEDDLPVLSSNASRSTNEA